MYIRFEGGECVLIRTIRGEDGEPVETVLAGLGEDPELNLFLAAEQGRRSEPEKWEGVENFHLLQALENFKRRLGGYKPALVAVDGKLPMNRDESAEEDDSSDAPAKPPTTV
jgi:hypothetical protein